MARDTHLSRTSCAAPQQVSDVSEMARALPCFPGAEAQQQSPPSCCRCCTVMKNSQGALVAMLNYSVQRHKARRIAVSQHVLEHPCPLFPSPC